MARWAVLGVVATLVATGCCARRGGPLPVVAGVTRATEWRYVGATPIQGAPAFHPQGLARARGRWYLSTVDAARKEGHVYEIDDAGVVRRDVRVGEGAMFHPGGMDFDGTYLWVPVAEYRPWSRSIVYRVDPRTMTASEAFRVDDHVGAVAWDPAEDQLVGVSWGSRRFFRWTRRGEIVAVSENPSFFVDYQDCKHDGVDFMVCGGIAILPPGRLELGGIALLELRPMPRIVREVPMPVLSPAPPRHVVTRNAVYVIGSRLYAVPDDDGAAALLVYELQSTPGPARR